MGLIMDVLNNICSDGSSSSIMAPSIANESCDAFTAANTPCTLGNMVVYSVNVSTTSHMIESIAFAKAKNIRLVIRNTGHEYVTLSSPFICTEHS